jgi:hypothetical protein
MRRQVLRGGAGDDHDEEQSQRVDSDVAFAAVIFSC